MSNPDRLSGLDASFLALEEGGAHMHVGSCMVFEGSPPAPEALVGHIERRLHLVPRYRQKLAFVPFDQARPVWVDDPHFTPSYHIRHTALPAPGGELELEALAGRVFATALDRAKPLWEIWLVEGLQGDRFALLNKAHHCLVDGISGVDITTVLFDLSPEGSELPSPARPWLPRPVPGGAKLLADAMAERAGLPLELIHGVAGAVAAPAAVLEGVARAAGGLGAMARAGLSPAPPSPFNVAIGPHRRFTWVRGDLAVFKATKDALGGTVNDVVLAAVSGALGGYLRAHGHDTTGLELKAMVPVSVRAETERGALGNRVTTMYAPLPVDERDPVRRMALVSAAMAGLKESGQAVGAEVLTRLTGFAPPTVMAQAARLQGHQRFFNLTVTNVPGPQFSLFLLGRRLDAIYPQVPLARNTALGIAIMSYDGQLNFGLLSDYDALDDLHALSAALRAAIDELVAAAGVGAPAARRNGRTPRRVTQGASL